MLVTLYFIGVVMASLSRRIQSPARQTLIAIDKATRDGLRVGLLETGNAAKDFLDDAVSDWQNKPEFVVATRISRTRLTVTITARGSAKTVSIWHYVDKGTEPHIIKPKTAKVLLFQPNYSPRTAPVGRAHVGSGRSSGKVIAAHEVHHPGSPARHFEQVAITSLKPPMNQRIDRTIRRALAQIG